PVQRGFDHAFGFLGGGSSYLYGPVLQKGTREPGPFYEDYKAISFRSDPDFYATDKITDYAVRYVIDAAKTPKPFFLYLAYNAPHWPLQARKDDIEKYKGVYDIGWDSIRTRRLKRQKELGIIPANTRPSIKDNDIPNWNSLTYEEQIFWSRKM